MYGMEVPYAGSGDSLPWWSVLYPPAKAADLASLSSQIYAALTPPAS